MNLVDFVVGISRGVTSSAVKSQLEMIEGVVDAIIKGRAEGWDPTFIMQQLYSDNILIDIQGSFGSKTVKGVRGGVSGVFSGFGLSLGGEYGSHEESAGVLRIARQYKTISALDFDKLMMKNTEELDKILQEARRRIEQLDKAKLPGPVSE